MNNATISFDAFLERLRTIIYIEKYGLKQENMLPNGFKFSVNIQYFRARSLLIFDNVARIG